MKNRHSLLAAMALATSLITTGAFAAEQAQQQPQLEKPCHWWQFRKCDNVVPDDALPPEAPREGAVISIDVGTNTAYLYKDGELVSKSRAATGSEKTLEHGEDMWVFHTPRGRHKVLRKIVDPIWRKPDWAFIEAGEKVPAPDSPKRMVKGHLGKYALDLGEGIMIHGTDDPDSIGKRVSHGCIRLPDKMLAKVYKEAKVGTEVFIFDSRAGTSEGVAGGD